MSVMNLYIYIDTELLEPDYSGRPQLRNLALARKVGRVANVVFQSKSRSFFSERNDFSWQESYRIGASSTPPQPNDFVQASTGPKPISKGQMCDWSPRIPGGPHPQFMTGPITGDEGFQKKYPTSSGMFGTKDQPNKWFNSIWCATANGPYNCIYTETTPTVPGMNYRAYMVENNYQVSWEDQAFAPGIFSGSWTSPWEFSMPEGTTKKYISWGYEPDQDPNEPRGAPRWFDYGETDPQKHNPSRAIGGHPTSALVLTTESTFNSASDPVSVSMRLDWADSGCTDETRRNNAKATFEYLQRSTGSWLNISNVYVGTSVSADFSLRPDTRFGDYLPGETETDKIRYYLRVLVGSMAPRFAPSQMNWDYDLTDESSIDGDEA